MRPLVVGIGNPYRGDDGIGPVVADALARRGDVDVELCDGEPTRLLECWADRDLVVVVDAVQGARPGTVVVQPLLAEAADRSAGGVSPRSGVQVSTHGGGIVEAIELGRQLDRLPTRLTLVGVAGAGFGLGDGLSAAVAAAVDEAIDAVVAAIAGAPGARLRR